MNGARAVELRIASATSADRDDLARRFGVAAPWVVVEPSAKDSAVYILNLPVVTGLLLVVGLIALFVEFSSPGIGVGGLVSLLCFALFFWSRFLGGTSGWLELVLFVVGAVFLAVELFLLPGFGVAGVSGVLLMLAALLMASQEFLVPQTHEQLIRFARGVVVLVGSLVAFLAGVAWIGRSLPTLPFFRRLVLAAPGESGDGRATEGKQWFDPAGRPIVAPKPVVPSSGLQVAVGDWGSSVTPLRPAGKARFHGQSIDVVTDGSFIDAGRQVRVIEVFDYRVVVSEVPASPTARIG